MVGLHHIEVVHAMFSATDSYPDVLASSRCSGLAKSASEWLRVFLVARAPVLVSYRPGSNLHSNREFFHRRVRLNAQYHEDMYL